MNKFEIIDNLAIELINSDYVENRPETLYIYMPNPVFTVKPKFCLIAQEPSLAWHKKNDKTLNNDLFDNNSRFEKMNFLFSEQDFIFHYCVYHYLCENSYDYYLTDISKGAMTVNRANIKRIERYQKWFPILIKELEILQKPILISIGKGNMGYLQKLGLNCGNYVMHYSNMNCLRFFKYYAENINSFDFNDINIKMKEFVLFMLNTLEFPEEIINERLEKLFNKQMLECKKGMFIYYRDEFVKIKNSL